MSKIQGSLPSFWQVLRAEAVASPSHLSWSVFSTLEAFDSQTVHFRQPELEFLGRVAGTFQWSEVQSRVGVSDSIKDVILVWVGPRSAFSEKDFLRVAKAWGLSPRPFPKRSLARSPKYLSSETQALERTALAGLDE